jgi:hypothetical protein
VYRDMEEWTEIRLRVLRGESSNREILRETRMHWRTLEKILRYSEPPGYRLPLNALAVPPFRSEENITGWPRTKSPANMRDTKRLVDLMRPNPP